MTIDISPEAVERLCTETGVKCRDDAKVNETLRALSAALTASQAETAAAYEALQVKPLVWVESKLSPQYLTADTGFGIVYRINAHRGPDNVMWWLGIVVKGENCADTPSAKVAAQSDFEARIVSAIITPADSKVALDRMIADAREAGMRKAVKIIETTYAARRNAGLHSGFDAMMSAKEAILAAIPKGKDHE